MFRTFLLTLILSNGCLAARAQAVADPASATLSNLRATAVNVDLLPASEASKNLGLPAKRWRSLVSRMGLFGNLASETALLNVMSDGNDFGGDWIAWFRHEGSAVNNESLIRHQHFSQGYTPQPIITGIAARGTIAAPAALHDGDYLFILDGRGYDGSNNNYNQGPGQGGFSDTSAQIAFQAAQNWAGGAHGSKITFKTTANGSTAPVARMVIDQDGMVAVNAPGLSLLGGASLTVLQEASHLNSGSANNDRAGILNVANSTEATHNFAGKCLGPGMCGDAGSGHGQREMVGCHHQRRRYGQALRGGHLSIQLLVRGQSVLSSRETRSGLAVAVHETRTDRTISSTDRRR